MDNKKNEHQYLREYAELIETGQVVVGYWIRTEVRHLIEDLDDPRYIFDPTDVHRRIAFQQRFCLQSKQPYYGKPLILMPWQTAYWEALYAFRMADTGLRRFTDSLLEVGRKNGKSVMAAGDVNADLFTSEGMTICTASNDDRQAKLIWKEVANMRRRLDPQKALTRSTLTELTSNRGTEVFRLSQKTENKDGFLLDVGILDEAHDVDEPNHNCEIAEAMERAMSSKDEPLFSIYTTNGFNRDCYLDYKLDYAKKVITGEIDDIHLLPFLYEQDSEQEVWDDPASWEKSNPSLRYGVKKRSWLERQVEKARHDKTTRIHMLTKDFNIPQSNAQSWLALEDYDYPTEPYDPEAFRGSYILGAVDLSATTDLSNAKVLIMRPGDSTKYILSHYWIPESKLSDSNDKEAGATYDDWARAGYITVCSGNEIDIADIADWFLRLYQQYELRPYKIGYDQRYAKVFIDRCEDYGFETEMLLQGKYLSNSMKLTEADLKAQLFNYNSNPVDKWCLRNACCDVDNYGNIQIRKAKGQHSMRIDGAATLVMIEEIYSRYKSDYKRLIGD